MTEHDWQNKDPREFLGQGSTGEADGGTPAAFAAEMPQYPVREDMDPPDDGTPMIPCMVGPCRYFQEIAQVKGVIAGREHRRLYGYCRGLVEESTSMPVHDQVYRYCSAYSPPWWSIAGHLQRVRSAPYQMMAAEKFHYPPHPRVIAYHMMGKTIGWVREQLERTNQQ